MSWKASDPIKIGRVAASRSSVFHDDERIVTFADDYQIIVHRGWFRNGGNGWTATGMNHTCKSIRSAAIDGRRARDRRESALAGCAVGPMRPMVECSNCGKRAPRDYIRDGGMFKGPTCTYCPDGKRHDWHDLTY